MKIIQAITRPNNKNKTAGVKSCRRLMAALIPDVCVLTGVLVTGVLAPIVCVVTGVLVTGVLVPIV